MLRALRAGGVFDTAAFDREPLLAITQRTYVVPTRPDGTDDEVRPDLVLLWAASAAATELWIEVKTGAQLSGDDQLWRYRKAQEHLQARDGIRRPAVVLLSPSNLLDRGAAAGPNAADRSTTQRWLSWQAWSIK
jgi:hypothetical protein